MKAYRRFCTNPVQARYSCPYTKILKDTFGHDSFRGQQKDVIDAVARGRDCIAVMATGVGKSMLYMIPPLVKQKPAVVISPLISLMKDQVDSGVSKGIRSAAINSLQKDQNLIKAAFNGEIDIIFTTPETLVARQNDFIRLHREHGLSLVAVDEAFLVTEWGNSFREQYLRVGDVLALLDDVPTLAVGATMSKETQKNVEKVLQMERPVEVRGSCDRPNISYHVFSNLGDEWLEMVEARLKQSPSIVYCITRKKCEEIAELLQLNEINADFYHGGMKNENRVKVQEDFMEDRTSCVVATCAFGMGIDKAVSL